MSVIKRFRFKRAILSQLFQLVQLSTNEGRDARLSFNS